MSNESISLAICPLFNFGIIDYPEGETSKEEAGKYVKEQIEKIKQGFQISEKVLLRWTKEEELNQISSWPFDSIFKDFNVLIHAKTFVLEIHPSENDDVKKIAQEVLLALRLHKEGNVFTKIIWFENKNGCFEASFCVESRLSEPLRREIYIIKVREIEEIELLLDRIIKRGSDTAKGLRIACERFNRSYEERRTDDKIIDFAIAFEALFFEGKKSPSNTGQIVGMGCSMLLGNDENERIEIRQFLKRAYDVRNAIVHGSEFDTPIKVVGKSFKLDDFVSELREYLRKSIKKLIQ
jgi:hypothetical protein